MGAVVALMLFCGIGQASDPPPWVAPTPPELYPAETLFGADRDVWLAGFVSAMRGYPADCQKALDLSHRAADEDCDKRTADAEARLEAALAVQSQDVMSTLDRVLWVGGAFVVGLAAGIIVGALVAR